MPQRAIVLFPTGTGIDRIEGIRRRHDPQTGLIPAHVTLVFPFESAIAGETLRSHVALAVRGLSAFQATLSEVTAQDEDYVVMKVDVGLDSIVALHDRLYSGPLRAHLSATHVYRPHLTLGRVSDPEERTAAIAAIRATHLTLSALIREVAVFSVADRLVEFVCPLAGMNVSIRPAVDSDQAFAFAVKKAALGEYIARTWGWDEVFQLRFHADDWREHRPDIIELEGRAIGTLEVLRRPDHIYIGEFYLLPEVQRKGIGTELLQRSIAQAEQTGLPMRLQFLRVNPVRTLYERHGFVVLSSSATHFFAERRAVVSRAVIDGLTGV